MRVTELDMALVKLKDVLAPLQVPDDARYLGSTVLHRMLNGLVYRADVSDPQGRRLQIFRPIRPALGLVIERAVLAKLQMK